MGDRAVVRRDVAVGVVAAILLTVALGCGKGGGDGVGDLTGATAVDAGGGPTIAPPAAGLPSKVYGAFVASEDALEAGAHAGNILLVVPSYADDARAVASALRGSGKVAILSAHHVFGGPEERWEQGWARTLEWAAPFLDRVAAVYVVDEPLGNGIPADRRDRAVARVRAAGYRTIVAEWVDQAIRAARPAGLDLYGVTCYDWPGVGGWRQDRCLTAYRDRPQWDLVIGQAYDLHPRNGDAEAQLAAWAELGRERAGVVFWVWRWAGQRGIGDDDRLLAAYDRAGGR